MGEDDTPELLGDDRNHDGSPALPAVPSDYEWYGAVRALYQELDLEIESRASQILAANPVEGVVQPSLCVLRGICCDFRVADHQLYATPLEVDYALMTRTVEAAGGDEECLCPFWIDGLCTAREERPLGCRTYFCDPLWQETGQELHEEYHRRLQEIGEQAGFEYRYGPFVAMIRGPVPDREEPDAGDS